MTDGAAAAAATSSIDQSSVDFRPASSGLFRRNFASVANIVRLIQKAFRPSSRPAHDPRTEEQKRRDALVNTQRAVERFVNMDIPGVAHEFGVDTARGLSRDDAAQRLAQHGPNKMDEAPPRPLWKLFLDQFNDLLVMLLIAAAIVSMALGEFIAGGFVIVIVLLNAILGCVQEYKAGNDLDALSSLSKGRATVLRDGVSQQIDAELLVPGDVVILETGAIVPADIRLIAISGLQSLEASLTGEPNGVKKVAEWIGSADYNEEHDRVVDHTGARLESKRHGDPKAEEKKEEAKGDEAKEAMPKKKEKEELTFKNMIYLGCSVHDGRGTGIVVKTGMSTQMGEINTLIQSADKKPSPLEAKLAVLGKKLGVASILISLVVFVIGVTTERGADPNSDEPVWLQMLLVTVSLVVAAVPEGLPAAVTVTLAIGMKNMARRNALVRTLPSVETLGSASVICTDKTGTLTAGVMTLRRIWFQKKLFNVTGGGYDPVGFIYPSDAKGVQPDADAKTDMDAVRAAHDSSLGGIHEAALFLSCACSNATFRADEEHKGRWIAEGNMSERPLVVAAAKVGIEYGNVREHFGRVHENTFSSKRKMMSTFIRNGGTDRHKFAAIFGDAPFATVVKGAPNVVIAKCTHQLVDASGATAPLTDADRADVMNAIDELSDKAFRVLCVAYKPEPTDPGLANMEGEDAIAHMEGGGLVFCALVASIDPERPGVAPSIRKAADAGIRVVMITGDFVKTARAIAINIGLLPVGATAEMAIDCRVIREIGDEMEQLEHQLEDMSKSDRKQDKNTGPTARLKELEARLDLITSRADVYARAKPVDKITIVRSLQRQGNVCSMTGDGVNDAPALKQADIGVAMGIAGTDVAKGASDMVLVDDKFETIVAAIEQGRTIYANITKFVYYLLSTNVSEVFLILIATGFLGLQTPLLPLQILWLNLATDGAPALALAVEITEPGIMSEGPRLLTEPLIEKVMVTGICIQTVVLTGLTLGAYIIALDWNVGSWDGENASLTPAQLDEGVRKARTVVILLIVFAELLRAYGARSLRRSIFQMGVFSNRSMQYAVLSAMILTVMCTHIPGVMDIFDVEYIEGREYALICVFMVVPIVVDELTKWVYRRIGFGERPRIRRGVGGGTPVMAAVAVDDEKEMLVDGGRV